MPRHAALIAALGLPLAGSASATPLFGNGFEAAQCALPAHFASALTPSRELHVATGGSDASGNGSPAAPFATLARALQGATPGTAIRIHPGTYAGGIFRGDLRGSAQAPIWIGGLAGQAKPVFSGGANALQLSRPAFVVLHDMVITGSTANGINIDDGGEYANPQAAQFVAVQRVEFRNIGGGGNQDCLKISGLYDSWVLDSHFERCGTGGSGVDFVGGHRSVVAGNRFIDIGATGVQAKGGSADILILRNRFENGGARALNMGGSTGFEFFRPPLSTTQPNAEARRIRARANLFIGSSQAPLNFVGCVDCEAIHNTVVNPGSWLVRILQETTSSGGFTFEPARNALLQNNLFLFRRGDIGSSAVNVGAGTDAASFQWRNNLFFASDQPANSQPNAPGTVSGSLVGLDPQISGPDYRIGSGSPAAGAGLALDAGLGDLGGACFGSPPSIGAWELQP